MYSRRIAMIIAQLLIVVTTSAQADDYFTKYHQFRHTSGLPGCAFGTTPDGRIGFDGALQQNIPIGYTPCSESYITGVWSGSDDSSFPSRFSGRGVNGNSMIGVGFGSTRNATFVSALFTNEDWDEGYNLQVQLSTETADSPAVSVGVMDLFDQRPRDPSGIKGARSFYITATKSSDSVYQPVYLTFGWGNGRFDHTPFIGLSWSFHEHFTLLFEYDSLSTNAGLAYGVNGRAKQQVDNWNTVLYVGHTDLERPLLGLAATYSR